MAYDILHFDGTKNPVTGDYPWGDIKDDPAGTRANRKSNADIFQFFQKLMANAGITPNNTPDNVSNTYQLWLAATPSIAGSLSVSTSAGVGGVTGTIDYKYNALANTLSVIGTLVAANAQNFTASPAVAIYTMGPSALPVGIRPVGSVTPLFSSYCFDGSGNRIMDDLGVQYIDGITLYIDNTGNFHAFWVKPAIAVTSYTCTFHAIIPLY